MPSMKLKVVKRGTHVLPLKEWNNDVPSPCEVVADTLADLQFQIKCMVERGGVPRPELVHQSLESLNCALKAAKDQNWELTIE